MRPNIVREPDRWKRAWSIKFFLVDQNGYWSVGSSCHFRQWLKLCWFNGSQIHSNVDNQVSLLSDKDIMWSCKGVLKRTLTMLPVHAMTLQWISDLTMFCPLFSWLKHFKIPPARILQSHFLDSKAGNAFSVLSHA